MPEYEYAAFVSYRDLDATEPGQQWAAWVPTLLERYTTPPELAVQPSLYGDPVPDKMERVFRVKDQLPAHGAHGALIHDALEKSRVLIVLCTSNAVASPWVADEIHPSKSSVAPTASSRSSCAASPTHQTRATNATRRPCATNCTPTAPSTRRKKTPHLHRPPPAARHDRGHQPRRLPRRPPRRRPL